jgi:hypothetical protein
MGRQKILNRMVSSTPRIQSALNVFVNVFHLSLLCPKYVNFATFLNDLLAMSKLRLCPVLGPTQPPIQWVPATLSPGAKRPGREADHSPPSSAEVKNAWNYTSTPHTPSRCSAQLKHRSNFTFTLPTVW